MTEFFRIGDRAIQAEDLPALLTRYQLWPTLIRGVVVDAAIADCECTEAELAAQLERIYAQAQKSTSEEREAWLSSRGLTPAQMQEAAARQVRVEKFKQQTWGAKVEAYFLTRKASLDRVLYSIIRVQDAGLAQELFFRIQDNPQAFAELARQYSQGSESHTGGLIGPVPLSTPHPAIAKTLLVSKPGQLWPPTRLAEWHVLVRLEKFFPAQLDDATRRQLIDEMFEAWVKDRVEQALTHRSLATVET